MAINLDHIYEEAMSLPDETKAVLADRIVEYLVTHINPDFENFQLDIVKLRRDEIRQKKVEPVYGSDALAIKKTCGENCRGGHQEQGQPDRGGKRSDRESEQGQGRHRHP